MPRSDRVALAPQAPAQAAPRVQRPRTRGDCRRGIRPCPWMGCKYHLGLEVDGAGRVRILAPLDEHGDPDLDAMSETCTLDVADRDGTTLEEVGAILRLTRERVRQIAERATLRLAHPSQLELLGATDEERAAAAAARAAYQRSDLGEAAAAVEEAGDEAAEAWA